MTGRVICEEFENRMREMEHILLDQCWSSPAGLAPARLLCATPLQFCSYRLLRMYVKDT